MRKSIFRTMVVFLLLSCMFISTAFAEDAVITGSDVNLRSGPGLNYNVVDCLAKGTAITVSDRSNSDWYAISVNGVSGYMSSTYIKIMEAAAPEAPVVSGLGNGTINAMYVRFRSGPSGDYSILGEYNKGKAVSITGTSGDWTAVMIDGKSGYVYSQYITPAGSETPAPAPEQPSVSTDNGSGSISFGDEVVEEQEQPAAVPEPTPVPTPAPTPVPTPTPSTGGEGRPGYITGDDVRFRSGPSTGYTILGSYNRGQALTIQSTYNDWTLVNINGKNGYVFSQYVAEGGSGAAQPAPEPVIPEYTTQETPEEQAPAVTEKSGYITGNNVRFRSGASMSAGIITELYFGNTVTIKGISGDWTEVVYNGTSGYVYSQYVAEGNYNTPAPQQPAESEQPADNNNTVTPAPSGSSGASVASFACQFVGYNYIWGGKSPSTGFDCSGLVYYCYNEFGYTLNRVAQDQANNGIHVDPSQLQPGDVLCFYSGSNYIGHSGIYIGDNKFVHAASASTGVIISELSGYYATRGFEARRIIY